MFTTERLIVDNLVPSALIPGGCAAKCDGTYKVGYEGGWEVVSIGTHAVVQKTAAQVVHQYRPWIFLYTKAESNANLRDCAMPALLQLVRNIADGDASVPQAWQGLLPEGQNLRFASALSDHAPGIASMFNALGNCEDAHIVEACKDLVYLQCWPHIAREVHVVPIGTAHCSLLTAHCSLLTAHCSLLTAHCSLTLGVETPVPQ